MAMNPATHAEQAALNASPTAKFTGATYFEPKAAPLSTHSSFIDPQSASAPSALPPAPASTGNAGVPLSPTAPEFTPTVEALEPLIKQALNNVPQQFFYVMDDGEEYITTPGGLFRPNAHGVYVSKDGCSYVVDWVILSHEPLRIHVDDSGIRRWGTAFPINVNLLPASAALLAGSVQPATVAMTPVVGPLPPTHVPLTSPANNIAPGSPQGSSSPSERRWQEESIHNGYDYDYGQRYVEQGGAPYGDSNSSTGEYCSCPECASPSVSPSLPSVLSPAHEVAMVRQFGPRYNAQKVKPFRRQCRVVVQGIKKYEHWHDLIRVLASYGAIVQDKRPKDAVRKPTYKFGCFQCVTLQSPKAAEKLIGTYIPRPGGHHWEVKKYESRRGKRPIRESTTPRRRGGRRSRRRRSRRNKLQFQQPCY